MNTKSLQRVEQGLFYIISCDMEKLRGEGLAGLGFDKYDAELYYSDFSHLMDFSTFYNTFEKTVKRLAK